jgi:PAS domain S-box-containing protein
MLSATIGEDFFKALVQHLASALSGDCVYVAELAEGPASILRTLAVYPDGVPGTDFEQSLPGSCGNQVLEDGCQAWSKEVRKVFPSDPVLERLRAEGYVGIRLSDSGGQVIGLIALVAAEPLKRVSVVKSVLEAFAPRAAVELERQRTNDLLRESEQRYRAFVATSPDAMWRIELTKPIPLSAPEEEQVERIFRDGYIAEANAALARAVGVPSPEELIGRRLSDVLTDTDRVREELRSAVRTRYSSATFETSPRGPNGEKLYKLRTQYGVVEGDELRRVWGTTRDVTDLKRAEMAVEASERRFREVFDHIRSAGVMIDNSGDVTYCNDSAVRLAESSRQELIGSNWLERIEDAAERDRWKAMIDGNSAGREPKYQFESEMRLRGASPKIVGWSATPLRDHSGAAVGLAAIGRDVTEQRALEARVARTEKLDTIGRMAAGIAHDFNNLLAVIMGHVALTLEQLERSHPIFEALVAVQSAATDCAALTDQLMAIGRRQNLKAEIMSLNRVISNGQDLLMCQLGPKVNLVLTLDPSLGDIYADPLQIRRVLTNLSTNARDAMKDGGTLTIATSNVLVGPQATESAEDTPPGSYVRLTVTDTGCGISEEVKQHLFDPFVTTKARGKGTGLGLTTVYGIVSQSGGRIAVRSELGHGTSFEILFPRSSAA